MTIKTFIEKAIGGRHNMKPHKPYTKEHVSLELIEVCSKCGVYGNGEKITSSCSE